MSDQLFNDSAYEVYVDKPFKCVSCEETIETDDRYYDDSRWTNDGERLCYPCYESECNHASQVSVVDTDGKAIKYYVTDHLVFDEYGEEPYGSEAISLERVWKSSDAWRGHYETSIKGWVEVPGLTGWTTGWPDETVQRKVDFNEWCENFIDGKADCPVQVAFVFDQTSNVFSTAIGVWVPSDDLETFKDWLNGSLEELTAALG